jgi:thioredoxin reductase (NADPH)
MKYDSVIIGSGVAGLTAALYLARANKSVLIIEDSIIGGTTATLDLIENYPGYDSISGNELVSKMFMQVSKLGVNINFMTINAIDFDNRIVFTAETNIEYKTLIIAAGTSVNKLNIDTEKQFLFKGLSYCAVCDGSLYKNKNIIVVTNGLTGKSSIDYLENITNNITVVDYAGNYSSNKFEVINNSQIIKINGQNRIESIDIRLDNGEVVNKACDAVFVSLGKTTNLGLYDMLDKQDGYLKTDENMRTNIDGVFVAGDIRYKSLRQIVTACADGAIAATEAIKFISNN